MGQVPVEFDQVGRRSMGCETPVGRKILATAKTHPGDGGMTMVAFQGEQRAW